MWSISTNHTYIGVASKIFTITTAHICDYGTWLQTLKIFYNHWPGLIPGRTIMRCNFIVYFIYIFLFHLSWSLLNNIFFGFLNLNYRYRFKLIFIIFCFLFLCILKLSISTVLNRIVTLSITIMFSLNALALLVSNFSKGQRNPSLSKL